VPHIPDHGLNLSSSKTKQRSSKSHSIRPEKAQHSADEDRGEGSSKGKTQEPELDTATYQPELSRKQKAKVRLSLNVFPRRNSHIVNLPITATATEICKPGLGVIAVDPFFFASSDEARLPGHELGQLS
jgi:hypothetical protein